MTTAHLPLNSTQRVSKAAAGPWVAPWIGGRSPAVTDLYPAFPSDAPSPLLRAA
jgi:hypothetical protein